MSEMEVREAAIGRASPDVVTAEAIGKAAAKLDELAEAMKAAKDEDGARYQELREEQARVAQGLTELQATAQKAARDAEVDEAIAAAADFRRWSESYRTPSKARLIGTRPREERFPEDTRGAFLYGVHEASARDAERQAEGKAILQALRDGRPDVTRAVSAEGKAILESIEVGRSDRWAYERQDAWGKATLGLTDATGGWVIPNAIVDEFITPAAITNIYRTICTVVSGVTAFQIDIPFRAAARARAVVAAWGATKENLNLDYNGYTATMYTLARIYDISNQFLRASRGAAEADVLSELAAAFAQGESYYIREGSGSSEPYGYTTALTTGPGAYRSTFTPSATTLAGSIAKAIATAAGALAGRGVMPSAAVLSAAEYWDMISQGTDTAGFFFNPAQGPTAINAAPGTLVSPFGIPVYADPGADLQGTAAVTDNLVVGDWKKLKVYFGQSYRVDTSDQAGTRWDTNLTGFRGEEEMGFDARPAVFAGYFQMITDIAP